MHYPTTQQADYPFVLRFHLYYGKRSMEMAWVSRC